MVEVLTYKATKVYTPQTNEWAQRAKDVEAIGKTVSGGLKDLAKIEQGKEKQELEKEKQVRKTNEEIEKQNKALAKEKANAYDKVLDAQADDLAQRWQIDLARQTRVINQQFELDPLSPEKENQIRAVAKDLQEQYVSKMSPENRERFISKTNSKTNEYILTDVKNIVKEQVAQSKNMMADNVKFAVKDAEQLAAMGDFDALHKNFIESRGDLENYLSGMMSEENKNIALRQFDQNYLTAIVKSVANNNPTLAREMKDNPAALGAILSGGDYVGELATRAELNAGLEQIDGMEFPKNARYQKQKEQAKLMNSLGLVELDYDNGGQKALTLASSNANPQLTRYSAELIGGGVGKDIDVAIKQAENIQQAKLQQAKYDGAVQSIFTASYNNLDTIKNSDLYKNGDEYTVGFADRYEKMLNDRRENMNNAVKISDDDLHQAYKDFTKTLEQIDGKSINPVIDAYTQLSKIQAALSVREGRGNEAVAQQLQQAFEDAVINQDFRSGLTQTIRNNWTPPLAGFGISGEQARDKTTFANRNQEVKTIKAENEAIAGFLALAGQGRLDEARQFYTSKRNAFYDGIYSNYIDMDSVLNAWKEGKQATVTIGNALYSAVERDADGQILFEPKMTKVKYNG